MRISNLDKFEKRLTMLATYGDETAAYLLNQINSLLDQIEKFLLKNGIIMQRRPEVFISYSHKDKKYFDEINVYLKSLENNCGNSIPVWSDKKIAIGDDWYKKIRDHMNAAGVVILLVTQNFLNSDFICNHELPQLLRDAEDEKALVIWVPAERSQVDDFFIEDENGRLYIAKYQAACDPKKPLNKLSETERQDVYMDICDRIKNHFDRKELAYTS